MKKVVICAFLLFPLVGSSQTGPGGVRTTDGTSALVLWLDANKDITLSGSSITVWNDLSGYGNNATPPTVGARPTFITSIANGYPSVDFDGFDDELRIPDNASMDLTSWEIIIVTKADVNKNYNATLVKGSDSQENYEFLGFSNGLFHLPIRYTSGDRTHPNTSANQYSITDFDIFEYTFSSAIGRDVLKNGSSIMSDNENGTPSTNNDPLHIGSELGTTGRFLDGDIAEIIICNTQLNAAEGIIIQNYLAAKYNRSLSTMDIYNEDDAVSGEFDHDVAGIGRVDASNIQNDAQGSGIVRILNPTGLGDNEFLIWGHNNGILQATNTADVPAPLQARLDRVWRVSEVSTSSTAVDVGDIDVRFDLTGLGSVTTSDLRLLVDTDDDGVFSDETPISGATSIGMNVYAFAGVTTIADNLRFTLGTINTDQTPLPVRLLGFTAELVDKDMVQLNWQTATEVDNDFFTVERSKSGMEWENLMRIDGAGNSSALLHYSASDNNPTHGVSYYRLKQTDFSGEFSYSQIRSVDIERKMNSSIEIHPNPTDDRITIAGSEAELSEISIHNSLGQDVTQLTKQVIGEVSTVTIDISQLRQGMYYIRTRTSASKVYKQ